MLVPLGGHFIRGQRPNPANGQALKSFGLALRKMFWLRNA
jgi:hypothetical protein